MDPPEVVGELEPDVEVLDELRQLRVSQARGELEQKQFGGGAQQAEVG